MLVHSGKPGESGVPVEKQAGRCVNKAIGMDTVTQGGLVIMDGQAVNIDLREERLPSHSVIQSDSPGHTTGVGRIPIHILGSVVLLDPAACQPCGYFPN